MKKISLLSLFTLVAATTFAQAVSQQEACERAEKFLKKQVVTSPLTLTNGGTTIQNLGARKAKSLKQTTSGPLPYYIYNAQDGQGYVIVSGDERAREILGYSETGSLSEETMPCGMKMLLDLYAQEIESLSDTPSLGTLTMQGTSLPAVKRANATRVNISPLMSCQWGQSSPYNGQCPRSGSSACYVGCAATAAAQIMYYWGHQKGYDLQSTSIPAYTTRKLGITCNELPATNFDWTSMKDKASSDAAAAKLCRYVGQALEMDYTPNGSEAWGADISRIYRDCFGYDKHTRLAYRQDYNYNDFEQLIYNEIADGRPVFLGGTCVSSNGSWGGHGFVCDGYQASTGYYHINWGWSGSYDGYFPLSALDSNLDPYGSQTTSTNGYNICLNSIIGIQPPVEGNEFEEEETRASIVDLSIVGTRTFARNYQNEPFQGITIFNAVYNHMERNAELVSGLGLYDKDGKLLEVLDEALLGYYERYDGFGLEFTFGNLSMGKGLEDGTYFIRSISKGTDSNDTWGLSNDAEHNYITATIAGNQLTLQPSVDLEISRVASSGSYYSRTYSATITNNGTEESRGLIYCFSSSKLLNVIQTDIAPGETKTYTIGSSSVAKITSDFDGHHVLWASSSTAQDIALTARAIDANEEGKFYGQTLRLDVSVTNDANTVYMTQVTVKLCKEGSTTAVATKSFTPNVEAKGIQTERLEFDGLTYNQPYTITLISGTYTVQIGEMTTSQPRTFNVYTVTPIEGKLVLGDINFDGEVTIADVTELVNIILGKASSRTSQGGENTPVADVNGDGLITIADVTALVNLILAK